LGIVDCGLGIGFILKLYIVYKLYSLINNLFMFGDWGLGIGAWAQSPIPKPQSPK